MRSACSLRVAAISLRKDGRSQRCVRSCSGSSRLSSDFAIPLLTRGALASSNVSAIFTAPGSCTRRSNEASWLQATGIGDVG
jgi:hypothetical protein